MEICVIGTGYVGLVTAACLADLGHKVIGVDKDVEKIEALKNGIIPIYEPGLSDIVLKNFDKGNLTFSTDLNYAVKNSIVVFITIGTPQDKDGNADLSQVFDVSKQIGKCLEKYTVIVTKSTVPIGTGKIVKEIIQENLNFPINFDIVSNPEFLREGSAVKDFFQGDRIVIGTESKRALETMLEIYKSLNIPIIETNIETAEMIKYASNAFLATKISFINAIAELCDRTGADVVKVAEGMGLDYRIGNNFLNAGIGFGGSCFPKDILALVKTAEKVGYDFKLLRNVLEINSSQKKKPVKMLKEKFKNLEGKIIGIWGLAFKPNTDDLREAPSIEIIKELSEQKAIIKVYDPVVKESLFRVLQDKKIDTNSVIISNSPLEAAFEVQALILCTEWQEFQQINLDLVKSNMKGALFFDGRNVFNPHEMKKIGFDYICVGRNSIC